jgi:hypothetical protein
MSKHTPGPWRAAKGTHEIFIQCAAPTGPYDVATITTLEENGEQSKAETQANARLIAAAPELLKALKAALEWSQSDIDGFEDISPTEEMLEARIDIIQAAIAKAESN